MQRRSRRAGEVRRSRTNRPRAIPAATGLALMICTGALLFATRAPEYAALAVC